MMGIAARPNHHSEVTAAPLFVFGIVGKIWADTVIARLCTQQKSVIWTVKHVMIGKLTSVQNGPQRDVKLVISASEVRSDVSVPPGSYDPKKIDHYEVTGLQECDKGIVTLSFILADRRKIRFYSTEQKFDMALLLDQLDATIGERRRIAPPTYT